MPPPPPRRLASPLAAIVLAGTTLLTGACGEDSNASVRISMHDLQFDPRDATVQVGQSVEWTNDEDAPHKLAAADGVNLRSSTLGPDDTFTFTPNEVGTISYVCTLHPGMTATLRVTE